MSATTRVGAPSIIFLRRDFGKVYRGCPTAYRAVLNRRGKIRGRRGAGLANVSVTMTVTDTQSGTVKTYVNPQGIAFQPIQDTAAFATCP